MGCIAIAHLGDKLMGLGGLGGSAYFLVGGTGATKGNVRPNGVGKERCLLQHHADLVAQRVDGDLL